MRQILATLFCAAMTVAAWGQRDSVRIAGRVTDTGSEPLEACIVAVLAPQDSAIIAYGMTDEDGRYRTQFVTAHAEVLMRLTGFNVKRQLRRVEARSQTLDFTAEEQSLALREVQVKAQKLWGSRDTLNYLVAAYMKEHDRTIGDVLKQLPGITIDGGVIKYQGTPINHFYIEDMDVLQGRYNIATEGIRAEDVATVQVLENHEHVKALQDQVPPESAAINLKLKEKAKGVWTKSANLGLGAETTTPPQPSPTGEGVEKSPSTDVSIDTEKLLSTDVSIDKSNSQTPSPVGEDRGGVVLWDNDLNLMYFGRNRQHVLFYGNENTGHSGDRAAQRYGGSGLGATVLTGILSPGSSPVGTTLRNNRHSVNLNNLAKLSATKQLHYNLSYKHDLQRRSSYEQTTYILPDGDVRIMAEDISARHTTNDAAVQLTYEDNGERRFLENKLEMAGSWDEGKGEITPPQPSPTGEGALLSPSTDAFITKSNHSSPSPVGEGRGGVVQTSHLRNLGLSNSTRWVHRTEHSGGFELRSTNTVQTTPQSLDVSGAMDARQDVEMTRVSSANSFSLVKDLRRHRWTIVPTAGLNFNYVGLESILRATSADAGTMDYLNARASLGASLRYVKNEFRMSFNLPLSLNFTQVRNTSDVEETSVTTPLPLRGGDGGGAFRLRLSPSFNLLWKASDNWTLSSSADYAATQTPWTQLITTYIMQNYRTMNRYAVSLNDSHSAQTSAKLNYKDILNEFFAYLQGGYSRTWSDIALGTTIDENAHTILQAEHMPHHTDNYHLTANATKGFDWHAARIEATASWRRNDSQTLRQGVKTDYHSDNYSVGANAAANIAKPLRLTYGCTWSLTRSTSDTYAQDIKTFSQNATLNVTILPNRLLFSATARHTHNSGFTDKKDYTFADASLTFKAKKKQEFVLSLDNIFNTHTFISRSNSDLTEYYSIYHLRPRSVMLKTHLNL